jgi:hypothetical protein
MVNMRKLLLAVLLAMVVAVPMAFAVTTVSQSIPDGAVLCGSVLWTAEVSGPAPVGVFFRIDGIRRWTDSTAPYQYGASGLLDTTTLANGAHVLTAQVFTSNTQSVSAVSNVTVANPCG